ncbi:MAG: hypothetical protein LBM94_04120 [Propionibacteriaceae bacterium]|jgi:hypothetical protein|nr:hypothetical protein [Propionibacteriaceae bacterium]
MVASGRQSSARVELHRRKQKFTSLLSAVDQASKDNLDTYVAAHLARYLVLCLCGDVEQSVQTLIHHYAKSHSDVRVSHYVGKTFRQGQNYNTEKLLQTVQALDPDWRREILAKFSDELRAFDSIYSIRNQVAHGGDVGVSLGGTQQYFTDIWKVLDHLTDMFEAS